MLGWVLIFLIVAIVFAILGFGFAASAAFAFARVLFWVFLGLLVLSVIVWLVTGRRGWWGFAP